MSFRNLFSLLVHIGTIAMLFIFIVMLINEFWEKYMIRRSKGNFPLYSSLQSGFGKDLITIIIGGLCISISSSSISVVKNLAYDILPATFLLGNILVFANTGMTIPLEILLNNLQENITELNTMLSQLSVYITQFNTFVSENNLIITHDLDGIMGVEVLPNTEDTRAQLLANRADLFDELIHDQIYAIEDLLERSSNLERQILNLDSNYASQLAQYIERLRELKTSYRHF